MHCTNIPRICAGAEAPKVAAPEVPYAQPGLKAILADAVQWDSFRDFLALGLPGGFMMQLEGNSYDITTLLAGLLGELAVRPRSTAPLDVRLQQHVRLSLPSPSLAGAMLCACLACASWRGKHCLCLIRQCLRNFSWWVGAGGNLC